MRTLHLSNCTLLSLSSLRTMVKASCTPKLLYLNNCPAILKSHPEDTQDPRTARDYLALLFSRGATYISLEEASLPKDTIDYLSPILDLKGKEQKEAVLIKYLDGSKNIKWGFTPSKAGGLDDRSDSGESDAKAFDA